MSNFIILVNRIAVGSADTQKEINEVKDNLSEYVGYKGRMSVYELINEKAGKYPFPDLDNLIDEEEIQTC